MEKNNEDQNFVNRKKEESLEISSTGYGLESVTKNTGEGQINQQTKETNQSCGGL